jgi:CheY-like chemotaxis protein
MEDNLCNVFAAKVKEQKMNKTIMYVDDEPWFVEALVEALRYEEYIVELATNGSEAIDKLKLGDKLPDLVVLDVIMPTGESIPNTDGGRRTGLKVHEIIRRQLGLKIPIIFLTVVDDPSVEREIESIERSHGIKDFGFLVKPVLPTELLERVSELLDIQKGKK